MEQSKFYQIKNITEHEYTLIDCDGSVITRPIQDVDKSASIFTIQDAKKGDILEFVDHGRLVVGIVSFVNERTGKVDVLCLLEDNKFKIGNFYALDTINPHPATKEQRDQLEKAMNDAGYTFDFEKKELKKIVNEEQIKKNLQDNSFRRMFEHNPTNSQFTLEQANILDKHIDKHLEQKPAWSEEDEDKILLLENICDDQINSSASYSATNRVMHELKDWLKSLKERVQLQYQKQ